MDGENITVCRVTPAITIRILKHLDFHTPVKGLSLGGISIGPDKNTCIAARLEMAPLQFENKILIHPRGS